LTLTLTARAEVEKLQFSSQNKTTDHDWMDIYFEVRRYLPLVPYPVTQSDPDPVPVPETQWSSSDPVPVPGPDGVCFESRCLALALGVANTAIHIELSLYGVVVVGNRDSGTGELPATIMDGTVQDSFTGSGARIFVQ